MHQSDSDNFDDPALKAAVRRAWQNETAPQDLVRRVRAILADRGAGTAAQVQSRRVSWTVQWIPRAAAAVVFLTIGLVLFLLARPHAQSLPPSLASALVSTHDTCCGLPDHHMPGLPRSNYDAIASVLTRRLGWQVLAAEPPSGNWQFKGASICQVGSSPSGHLVFKRPNQNLSIFSLPLNLVPGGANGSSFDQTLDGHVIAAFAQNGSIYCFVGSSGDHSLDRQTIDAIRSQLEPRMDQKIASRAVTVAASPINGQ